MKNIILNQYQSYYEIKNKKIVIDFLLGKLKILPNEKENDNLCVINQYSEEVEIDSINLLKKLSKIKNKTLNAVLIPSYKCNMKCIYCYEGNITNSNSHMDCSYTDKLINVFGNILAEEKKEKINLTLLGGEPILNDNFKFYDDFFSKFNKYFKTEKITCITNGLEIPRYINKLINYGINCFQITLDGSEEIHNTRRKAKDSKKNSFQIIANSINMLLKNNIQTYIRVNIDKTNIHSLAELSKYILDQKWIDNHNFKIYLYPISENGCNKSVCYLTEVETLSYVLETLSKLPDKLRIYNLAFHGLSFINSIVNNRQSIPLYNFCAANNNQYVFDCCGNAYTCWFGVSDERFKVGYLEGNSYSLFKEQIGIFRKRNINEIYECSKCKYKFICGGGCTYKALTNKNQILAPNCADFGKIIEYYLSFLYESELK